MWEEIIVCKYCELESGKSEELFRAIKPYDRDVFETFYTRRYDELILFMRKEEELEEPNLHVAYRNKADWANSCFTYEAVMKVSYCPMCGRKL